jgi:predicted sugar kinase
MDGELDVDGALILDAGREHAEELHAAFERGQPVVVRAETPEHVKEALARPEVACVLVRNRELLEVDLVKLTYGE